MNKTFDYNGVLVAPSKPTKVLRTVKKVLHIDSADRDSVKYYTNGDVVYYLPRVYENVLSIRLRSATFPTPVVLQQPSPAFPQARTHSYANGQNISTATWTGAGEAGLSSRAVNYFLIDIEGLNKNDETTLGAQRSTYPDSFFAKIPINLVQGSINIPDQPAGYFINYNDHTEEENISKYSPPIGKLDRLRVVTRLHSQQGRQGFIYWTSNGGVPTGSNNADYSLTFEIEMLDNNFDDFSTFETRVGQIGHGGYGC